MIKSNIKLTRSKKDFINKFLISLNKTIGDSPVVLHEPVFKGNEWKYVKDCLDTTFVSSVGNYVKKFEDSIANYTGAKYVVAIVNGSCALQLALEVCGIKPGDEVLLPSLTFVATANAVTHCGAHPHFVDSDKDNLAISSTFLKEYLLKISEMTGGVCINKYTKKPIRGLLPMHVFGHPADLDKLLEIAHDFNLILIEDAAEALGSFYFGKHVGTFGTAGVLSFNGNKIITTGGGGAILTDDKDLAFKAKHLSTNAKLAHNWDYIHDEIGYNYRMPNINAALGFAQMEELEKLIISKRKLYYTYEKMLSSFQDVNLVKEPPGCKSNYWLQAIKFKNGDISLRNSILKAMNNAGYMARPVWSLLHKFRQFEKFPRSSIKTAEILEREIINIPSSSNILD